MGVSKGLQLWINLSSENKMIEPRYQELLKEDIKRAETDGVEVIIIAGESMGVNSPAFIRTPAMYLDFTLKPGAEWHQSILDSWNGFVCMIEGEGVFGSSDASVAKAHNLLVLGSGDGLKVWNKSSQPLRFASIRGQPLNEAIAQYGPFVINTKAYIQKTFEGYHFHKKMALKMLGDLNPSQGEKEKQEACQNNLNLSLCIYDSKAGKCTH
ncbi:pirin-like protein [Macadamia integrifolia]|uniref:pirin-like protein n=1 Tax=Macadamia integrifolia TaxID=60698 RepID=UPI001C4FC8A7|nr:pirin-like protein [Macadamia integrifolia]XP_042510943.1 pirin-like protein [Macadamia integrifolia]